ncbi:hypothetical protein [Halarsenatibacter silvermanii]|uniref:Uncharacterized protein n=1 Tax=Halarsenatibacter silvermanii TaxID=321763 RepID=A0A1G9RAN9_9FIRM|nr:hypothetical protein [Halarsenatibacter silvermanii]SDM19927.1 hypothetical protein SAMN04488692_12110 [Halarsenatibacter silvermanii]
MEKLLERLYEREYQLRVKFEHSRQPYMVDLGFNQDDCEVSNTANNFRFRTWKGMNYQKYESFEELLDDIKKTARKKYGFDFETYEIRAGSYFQRVVN